MNFIDVNYNFFFANHKIFEVDRKFNEDPPPPSPPPLFVLAPLRLNLMDFDKFNRSGPIQLREEGDKNATLQMYDDSYNKEVISQPIC